MATVKPFRALRPFPQEAPQVAAVPYDVVNTKEARALAADNPLSFLHVSRPEIDLPDGTSLYANEVYQRAASNFDRLISDAPLTIEDEASFYIYRLAMGDHQQTGIVACCSLDEYDSDLIRKHEKTRKDKEDDRTRHMLTLRAQTGPVFMTYRPNSVLNLLVTEATSAPPLFDFTAPDGVQHTIWRVEPDANEAISTAFTEVAFLYIADGHHRARSASRARESLKAENQNHSGAEEYNYFQGVLFPASEVQILPYNRVVKGLNGLSTKAFVKRVETEFEITPQADPTPPEPGSISMYVDGTWYGLKLRKEVTKPIRAIDGLDVSILQEKLLGPVLEIEDIRTDERIDFVGGIRGTAELARLVDEGQATVAFSMFPISVEDLMQISDGGEIMPPKSTWFEPKLRDGLLSHLI